MRRKRRDHNGRQRTLWPQKELGLYSRSAWVSLAVKSLRLGWPAGLRQAAPHLTKSYLQDVLICGLLEDVFPPESEIGDAVDEVVRLDYDALCIRETHHGRGYTERFCNMETVATKAARQEAVLLRGHARALGFWLPRRSLNCFYTWTHIAPDDPGQRRTADTAPWTAMPTAVLDHHTKEGKKAKRDRTIISGDYDCHRELGILVAEHGWEYVRDSVHRTEGANGNGQAP